jgi:hypothetical protein
MSDEDFISRWSRRKREAAQSDRSAWPSAAPDMPEALPSAAAAPATSGRKEPANAEEGEFDLATLPPIDSITGATDITAFLRKGVPLELTRAALRRAWLSDPVIRDFIGPAENAWDFTDPNAMAGFGALDQTAEQVRELAARIVGRVRNATEELARASDEAAQSAAEDSPDQDSVDSADSQSLATVALPVDSKGALAANDALGSAAARRVDVMQKDQPQKVGALQKNEPQKAGAMQKDEIQKDELQKDEPKVRRTHGGALPR